MEEEIQYMERLDTAELSRDDLEESCRLVNYCFRLNPSLTEIERLLYAKRKFEIKIIEIVRISSATQVSPFSSPNG